MHDDAVSLADVARGVRVRAYCGHRAGSGHSDRTGPWAGRIRFQAASTGAASGNWSRRWRVSTEPVDLVRAHQNLASELLLCPALQLTDERKVGDVHG